VWTLCPLVIHIPASLAFSLNRRHYRRRTSSMGDRVEGRLRGTVRLLATEVKPCFMHSHLPKGTLEPNTNVLFLHSIASIAGFIHVIIGTFLLSSLLFAYMVVATAILLRYFSSVIVCKVVLMIELEGMHWVKENQEGRVDKEGLVDGQELLSMG
jgi:hypothetical protein